MNNLLLNFLQGNRILDSIDTDIYLSSLVKLKTFKKLICIHDVSAENIEKLKKYYDYVNCSFVTSDPSSLKFYNKNKKNIFYIPNPSDLSIDNLKIDMRDNNIYDMFIALSHGQHRATLKKFYKDEREDFILNLKNKLVIKTPNICSQTPTPKVLCNIALCCQVAKCNFVESKNS